MFLAPGLLPGIGVAGGLLPHRMVQALEAVKEDSPHRNHLAWSSVVGRGLASSLFDRALYDEHEKRMDDLFAPYFPGSRISLGHQLQADQHEWLPHNLLAKVDRASMAFSLEARVPFLDHRVVEFAARLPGKYKLRGLQEKVLLKRAVADLLPASITRRPKQPYRAPIAESLLGEERPEYVAQLLSPSEIERVGCFDPAAVSMIWRRHSRGLPLSEGDGMALVGVLSSQLLHRLFIQDFTPRPVEALRPVRVFGP